MSLYETQSKSVFRIKVNVKILKKKKTKQKKKKKQKRHLKSSRRKLKSDIFALKKTPLQ